MKIKKIWKLYQELRRLRRKSKTLEYNLSVANAKYNELYYKKLQEPSCDTMYFFNS